MPPFTELSRQSMKRADDGLDADDEQRIESTLIRWANHFLSQGDDPTPRQIANVTTDLSDGAVFCLLLTTLGDMPIKFNQRPKNQFQMVDNVKIALAAMNDIFGNAYWEVNDVRNGDRTTNVEILMTVVKKTQVLATVKNPMVRRGNISDAKAAELLTTWVNKQTQEHDQTLESLEFSFRDGRLLAALVHHFHPHLIDYTNMKKNKGVKNNEEALTAASWCGIPKLIRAEDLSSKIDTMSLVVYLAVCHKILSTGVSEEHLIKNDKACPISQESAAESDSEVVEDERETSVGEPKPSSPGVSEPEIRTVQGSTAQIKRQQRTGSRRASRQSSSTSSGPTEVSIQSHSTEQSDTTAATKSTDSESPSGEVTIPGVRVRSKGGKTTSTLTSEDSLSVVNNRVAICVSLEIPDDDSQSESDGPTDNTPGSLSPFLQLAPNRPTTGPKSRPNSTSYAQGGPPVPPRTSKKPLTPRQSSSGKLNTNDGQLDPIEAQLILEAERENRYLQIENDRLSTAITQKRMTILEEMQLSEKKLTGEAAKWTEEAALLLKTKQQILEKIKKLEHYIATKGLLVDSITKPPSMLQDLGGVVLNATALALKIPNTKGKSPLAPKHKRTVSNAVLVATAEVLAADEDKVRGITKFQRIVRQYLKGGTRKDMREERETVVQALMNLQNYTALAARRITEEVHALIPPSERAREASAMDLRATAAKVKTGKGHLNLNKNLQTLLANSPTSLKRAQSITSVGSKSSTCVPPSLETNKLREIVNHCQDFAGFHEELADDMKTTLARNGTQDVAYLFLERMDHFRGKHLNYVRLVFCAMFIEMWKQSLQKTSDDGRDGLRSLWDTPGSDVDCSGYAAPLQRLNEYYALLKRLSEVSLGKIERDAYVGAARDMRLALVDIHSERRREINRMQLVYINWLFGLSGQSGHKKETIVSHKRWFLGYGDVTEVDQKSPSGADMDKKSHRGTRTFLFNDMIVMCRKKERIFTNLSKEKRYRVEKTLRLKGDFRVTDISGRGTACTSIQLSGIHAAEGLIMGAGTGTDASGTIAVKGRREGRRWVRMLETVSNAQRHVHLSKDPETLHHGMGRIYLPNRGWFHSYVALSEKSLYIYQAPDIGDPSTVLQSVITLPIDTLRKVYTIDNPPPPPDSVHPPSVRTPAASTAAQINENCDNLLIGQHDNKKSDPIDGWTALLARTPLPPGGWFNTPAHVGEVDQTLVPNIMFDIDEMPPALMNANTTNYIDNLIYGLENAYVAPEEGGPKNYNPDISNPADSVPNMNPAFFVACCSFLLKHGLSAEGVFRVPGNGRRVKTLQNICATQDFGTPTISPEEYSVNDVATALKLYLRELPTSLLGNVFYHRLMNVSCMPQEHQARAIRLFMHKLPSGHREILKLLLNLLDKIVGNKEANMMDVSNLVVCLGPSLLWDASLKQAATYSSSEKASAGQAYGNASQVSIVRNAQEAACDMDAVAHIVEMVINLREELFRPLPDVYFAMQEMDAHTNALKLSYATAGSKSEKTLAAYKNATCAALGGQSPHNAEAIFEICAQEGDYYQDILFVTDSAEWDEWNHQFSVLLA